MSWRGRGPEPAGTWPGLGTRPAALSPSASRPQGTQHRQTPDHRPPPTWDRELGVLAPGAGWLPALVQPPALWHQERRDLWASCYCSCHRAPAWRRLWVVAGPCVAPASQLPDPLALLLSPGQIRPDNTHENPTSTGALTSPVSNPAAAPEASPFTSNTTGHPQGAGFCTYQHTLLCPWRGTPALLFLNQSCSPGSARARRSWQQAAPPNQHRKPPACVV